MNQNNNIETR